MKKLLFLCSILLLISCTDNFDTEKIEVTFGFENQNIVLNTSDKVFIMLSSDNDLRSSLEEITMEALKYNALKVHLYRGKYTMDIFLNDTLFISQIFNITTSKLYLIK